jgi:hypothetical protein
VRKDAATGESVMQITTTALEPGVVYELRGGQALDGPFDTVVLENVSAIATQWTTLTVRAAGGATLMPFYQLQETDAHAQEAPDVRPTVVC